MDAENNKQPAESVGPISSPVVEVNSTGNESQQIDLVLPKWRLIFISISLCIGLFLSLLDTTIVATSLFTIGLDLHTLQKVTWVALAYTLAYLSFCIIIARLADIIGRRNAWIVSLVLFLGFSLGCGFAQSLNVLIACRVLQGIGGSGLYSLTFVIIPEIAPPTVASYLGGIVGAVVACAGVLGPLLGGIITKYTTWRWIFWINAPIAIIPFALFVVAWPKPHMIAPVQKRSIKELDVIGSTLVIAASILVVFSFQEAGVRSNIWGTPLFITTLLIGCLAWCLLFGWEILVYRFWEDRFASMFPFRLTKQRVYMSYVLSTLLIGFPYFLVIYSLPLRFQVVNGKSPLIAGVSLLPMLGAVAVSSTIGGGVNSKRNNAFPVLVVASCLMTLGTGLMSTLAYVGENVGKGGMGEIQSKCYGFQVLIGLGFGLTVSTVSIGAGLEADLKDTTVAQGIIAQMRVLGGSIGIAASTAILGVTQRKDLITTGIVTEQQLGNLQAATKTFTQKQGHAVRQAYSDAFSEDLRVCAIIAGAAVLITLGTFRRNQMPVMERRKEQYIVEQRRLRELKRRSGVLEGKKEGSSSA